MEAGPSFGSWLQRRRKGLDLTQAELARRIGYARVTIHKVETDQLRASRQMAEKLADALAIDPTERAAFLRFARDDPRAGPPPVLPPLADRVPAAASSRRRHNLPVPPTRFIGRGPEVEMGCALLRGEARLLTLTGAGGIGKTRLALELAAALVDAFPDGVWFVDLAPLADPDLLLPAVAAVLGLRDRSGQPLQTTLVTALRGRRLLLLLDNCEHLIDACARLSEELLGAAPDVRILATSREALRIAGEVSRPVPPLTLPPPDAVPSVDQLRQYEAVRLFAERARSVRPSFAVTGEQAAALAQLCRRLDGIPLALELAAARVGVLSLGQIVARLDDRFRLLTGGSRTALPRQQTLRATIDWSYDLLSGPERSLWQRLAVFAGGWTLEAAEVVCADGTIDGAGVLEALSALVAKSLVVVEQRHGEARYRLLETLRQYAWERLAASGEATTRSTRHAHHYLALGEQAEPALYGPDQAAWLGRLEVEHDNLRAALAWCLDSAEGTPGGDAAAVDVALRLAGAIQRFWFVCAHPREGLAWLERALARGEGAPASVRAKALLGAALLAFGMADARPERWQPLAEASLTEYRRAGDRRGAALALRAWGGRLRPRDYPRGMALLEQALSLAREEGEPWLIGWSLMYLAHTADLEREDERARARRAGEESLTIFRRVGDIFNIVVTQRALGRLALREGAYDRAAAAFAEELVGTRALKDLVGSGLALQGLGDAWMGQGDVARARSFYEQAVALWRELGAYRGDLARTVSGLGRAVWELGEPALAQASFQESLRLWQELGDRREIAGALEVLGCLAAARGHPERAVRLIGAAAALRDAIDNPLTPDDRAKLDRDLEPVSAALGDDRRAAAWADGRAMTLEQAIADALAEEASDRSGGADDKEP